MRSRVVYDDFKVDTVPNQVRRMCCVISLIVLLYAVVAHDVPVAMLAIAYVTGEISSCNMVLDYEVIPAVQVMLRSFSVTLFVGAIGLMCLI